MISRDPSYKSCLIPSAASVILTGWDGVVRRHRDWAGAGGGAGLALPGEGAGRAGRAGRATRLADGVAGGGETRPACPAPPRPHPPLPTVSPRDRRALPPRPTARPPRPHAEPPAPPDTTAGGRAGEGRGRGGGRGGRVCGAPDLLCQLWDSADESLETKQCWSSGLQCLWSLLQTAREEQVRDIPYWFCTDTNQHFSDLSTGDVMSLLGESENPGEKLRGSASRSKILFYENVMIFVLIVYWHNRAVKTLFSSATILAQANPSIQLYRRL